MNNVTCRSKRDLPPCEVDRFLEIVGSLVDYWDKLDDRTLFADMDHLNEAGAAWFGERVLHDCFSTER